MRKIVAIIAWAWIPFLWTGVRAQSAHDQKQRPNSSANQTQPDSRGTEDSPLIVETHSRPNSEQEAAKTKRKDDEKELIDRRTFYRSVVNTIFTGLLTSIGIGGVAIGVCTLKTISRQTVAGEKASVAAESTMLLTQRADVLIKSISSSTGQLTPETTFNFWIKNYGTTRANKVFVNIVIGLYPAFPGDTNAHQIRYVLAAGEMRDSSFNAHPGVIAAVLRGQSDLGFGGEITYTDVFEKPHVTYCEGRYNLELGGFEIIRNEGD
jgi:hypothetical protein